MAIFRSHVLICGGTGCTSNKSQLVRKRFEEKIKEVELDKEVQVVGTGCFGLCEEGPIVIVYPEGSFYSKMTVEKVDEIVDEHLLKGRIVEKYLFKEKAKVEHAEEHKSLMEVQFYSKQKRVALRNCGLINPEDINEYIARDGYTALGKVLTEMTPEDVIQLMKEANLRGRGGAGFPAGVKWSFAAPNKADQKYIICNADEGDPGAFMDRSVLEGDPHAVLEA
ncbi:MAG TPA: NAD(P)H-dependent oxidoreductase subunit E, partial [Sedimentibacter sp.]|nr:NAD(P)H-dependent oxidoreductase subunit E [Sedimentibacter sp.]